MAAKSNDERWRETCATGNLAPGQIKRLSRGVVLRPDWESYKLEAMGEALRIKFNQEPYKSLLINTGELHIQEGNYWNDRFWGVCLKTGLGENHLGKLIMEIRKEIKGGAYGDAQR
jgi:hypothetical protein